MISKNIFNPEFKANTNGSLFLGERPGLFDTVDKKHPEVWKLYKTLCSLDWDENEFDYSSCNTEFKTCSKTVYDMMIKTQAWQWEADSVASRSLGPIMANLTSSSELWALYARITVNEVTHSAAYSEIVRNSFDDPSVVKQEVLKVQEAKERLTTISNIFDKMYVISHEIALGVCKRSKQEIMDNIILFLVAMLCLERIQFMASFAITFAIADTGMFMPIGKAVQKIAQEEVEVHAEAGILILKNELSTEIGRESFERVKLTCSMLIAEVIESEFNWIDYAFSEGRELVGVNKDNMKNAVLYFAKSVYSVLGITDLCTYKLPDRNPIKYIENWLNIGKIQPSPQEESAAMYKLNIMTRTDEGKVYDTDF